MIGIDVGYGFTKDSDGNIFASKIGHEGITKENSIEIDEITYQVGTGKGTVDFNKINSVLTKACFLTCICKNTNRTKVEVATGLLIGQYKQQKEELRNTLMQKFNIKYEGKEREIDVVNVKVYPQGIAALYAYQIPGDAIIVDIGYRTVDIALYQNKSIAECKTIYKGVLSLYGQIIQEINSKFDMALENDDGEKILNNGLKIYGEVQDIDFIRPICKSHVGEILDELILNFPYKTTPVYLIGGGAKMLGGVFQNRLGNALVLKNSQFANAVGFKRLGELM